MLRGRRLLLLRVHDWSGRMAVVSSGGWRRRLLLLVRWLRGTWGSRELLVLHMGRHLLLRLLGALGIRRPGVPTILCGSLGHDLTRRRIH